MRDDLRKGKGAYPAFHFSFEPGRLTLGLGNFEFARDILDNYQYAILEDKAGEELQEIVKDMEKKGFRISEPKYKKIPLRFDANHPRAELLRHKGFIVWSDEKSPREISEPKLINYCLKRFEEMLPVYKWLGDLENF
jgi:hypothetical protein